MSHTVHILYPHKRSRHHQRHEACVQNDETRMKLNPGFSYRCNTLQCFFCRFQAFVEDNLEAFASQVLSRHAETCAAKNAWNANEPPCFQAGSLERPNSVPMTQFQFGLSMVCNGFSNSMSCDNDVSFIFVLHL